MLYSVRLSPAIAEWPCSSSGFCSSLRISWATSRERKKKRLKNRKGSEIEGNEDISEPEWRLGQQAREKQSRVRECWNIGGGAPRNVQGWHLGRLELPQHSLKLSPKRLSWGAFGLMALGGISWWLNQRSNFVVDPTNHISLFFFLLPSPLLL